MFYFQHVSVLDDILLARRQLRDGGQEYISPLRAHSARDQKSGGNTDSMKLSIGIVGLPNVGKSSLFRILTQQEVNVANYPFATIDPNIGVVAVPDERLDKLEEMSKSAKKIPAVVEFYDIAGLVKGAHEGQELLPLGIRCKCELNGSGPSSRPAYPAAQGSVGRQG